MTDKKETKKTEEAPKKAAKKAPKKSSSILYKITKSNGNVIERNNLSESLIKGYEAKGCTVEEL